MTEILRCPDTGGQLLNLRADKLAQLNQSIRESRVLFRSGERVGQTLDAGLVTHDGRWIYPVFDGVPVMLTEKSIDGRDAATSANQVNRERGN